MPDHQVAAASPPAFITLYRGVHGPDCGTGHHMSPYARSLVDRGWARSDAVAEATAAARRLRSSSPDERRYFGAHAIESDAASFPLGPDGRPEKSAWVSTTSSPQVAARFGENPHGGTCTPVWTRHTFVVPVEHARGNPHARHGEDEYLIDGDASQYLVNSEEVQIELPVMYSDELLYRMMSEKRA